MTVGIIFTSTKEDIFSSLSVCLLATLHKNFQTNLHEIFWEGWQRPVNELLNFGSDPDHRLDTGIVFRFCHYREIWKVVNGHKSAAPADLSDGSAGKTCLGGGMHCPNASSYYLYHVYDTIIGEPA